MKRVAADQVCYTLSARHPPVARVAAEEIFILETKDCYSNQLKSSRDVFTKEMWSTVNPATGPVYVEGARPGDVLAVRIEALRLRDYAVMCVEQGSGALGAQIEGVETTIQPIRRNRLKFSSTVSLPVQPMVGVMGTAPAGEPVPTGTPGEHGGNLDCKVIQAGAIVYLPVNVPGALLAAGDLHALMGDGEVCICAAEVAGELTLRAALRRPGLPTPAVETATELHVLASAVSLDECERLVLDKTHRFLTQAVGLKPNDAARLMSLAGQLQVCQVVDPLKTMRFALPKSLLADCGWQSK